MEKITSSSSHPYPLKSLSFLVTRWLSCLNIWPHIILVPVGTRGESFKKEESPLDDDAPAAGADFVHILQLAHVVQSETRNNFNRRILQMIIMVTVE